MTMDGRGFAEMCNIILTLACTGVNNSETSGLGLAQQGGLPSDADSAADSDAGNPARAASRISRR